MAASADRFRGFTLEGVVRIYIGRMAFFRNLALAVSLATAASTLLAQESFSVRPGEIMESVECLADPTQTYTLYLPRSYDHRAPVRALRESARFASLLERLQPVP